MLQGESGAEGRRGGSEEVKQNGGRGDAERAQKMDRAV